MLQQKLSPAPGQPGHEGSARRSGSPAAESNAHGEYEPEGAGQGSDESPPGGWGLCLCLGRSARVGDEVGISSLVGLAVAVRPRAGGGEATD